MKLIQSVKIRTGERGLFKMSCFETPCFQMGVFKTRVTVASVLWSMDYLIKLSIGDSTSIQLKAPKGPTT